MTDHDVRLRLLDPAGRLELAALVKGGEKLLALLNFDRPRRWMVFELGRDGLDLAVGLAEDNRDDGAEDDHDALRVVTHGLRRLSEGTGLPDGWDEGMAQDLLELAELPDHTSVTGVEIAWGTESVVLDAAVREHIEGSLLSAAASLGSVRGLLRRYNGARGDVGILDRATGRSVRARFDEGLRTRLLGVPILEREVLAWGTVSRNPEGQHVQLQLEDFELVEPSAPPAPVDHVAGIYGPDWTGGLSSEEWIRRQREH